MCGLTGFLALHPDRNETEMQTALLRMSQTIVHRGPDDNGEWLDATTGIALGFRRLSIVDISPAGHQPMESATGRFVVIFNGEVYNANALRQELEQAGKAPHFRGHSDTEVLLAAFEAWGVEAAIKKSIGMFAIALWDKKERVLHLIRDRLGVKPMYYGMCCGKAILFGSELKALRAYPNFDTTINRDALALYLRYCYIPSPWSIYKGIYKLPPGTILSIPAESKSLPEPKAYWSGRDVAEYGNANPYKGTPQEAVEDLDALLRDSIALRMIADVPLGVFLSGGIDSSTIVALMQAQSAMPVKSFSIGFHEASYNEANYAKAVANHLKTDHTELYVSPEEAQAVIPKLPTLYDEPFADSSQIPTYLVSALARKSVTVSLSGDGGDELFGGYNRYFQGRSLWNRIKNFPRPLRKMVSGTTGFIPRGIVDAVYKIAAPVIPKSLHHVQPGEKLAKIAEILASHSPDDMYRNLISHWKCPESVVISGKEAMTPHTDSSQLANLDDFTLRMMYLDLVTYLPDDILVKVDRASMGISLEAREPLLDHRIVEFAWKLPLEYKIREGQGKWVLRQVLYRYVPQELIDRPKMGFGVPIDSWLRGPLREWAEDLLSEERLKRDGFLNPEPIRKKWREHLEEKQHWHYYLWDILMFQAWLDT